MPAIAAKPKRTTARSNTSVVARCQHLRADGKRCADAVYPGHVSLCHHHLGQQMRGIANGDIIAADILHAIGNFQSAAAINVAIGKILIYQLTSRISRQDALALSYQCQLLLQTLPLIQKELKETGFHSYWRDETKRILGVVSDLDRLTFPSLLPESDVPLHPKDWFNPQSPAETPNPSQTASPPPVTSAPSPSAAIATSPAAAIPATTQNVSSLQASVAPRSPHVTRPAPSDPSIRQQNTSVTHPDAQAPNRL